MDHEGGPVAVAHRCVEQRIEEQRDLIAALGRGEFGPRGQGDVPQLVVQEPRELVVDQAGLDLPCLLRLLLEDMDFR